MNLPVPGSTYVLDACALIAFLQREPGAEQVELLLVDAPSQCAAHALNLCEVYHDLLRTDGLDLAGQAINDLVTAGVQVREDMDMPFWQQAGKFKVDPGKLSLADCFALSLAVRMEAVLVTSDRGEFERIVGLVPCPIQFIR
ncbi:MAG: PIN domain-containing protein [Caldilineaceae bacterium]|nr:PIN domain-containing protein [Caldilineaceae bacterium]